MTAERARADFHVAALAGFLWGRTQDRAFGRRFWRRLGQAHGSQQLGSGPKPRGGVAMEQAAEAGKGDDAPEIRRLRGAVVGRVLSQGEVDSVVVVEVAEFSE